MSAHTRHPSAALAPTYRPQGLSRGINLLVEPLTTRKQTLTTWDNKVVPWGDLSTGYGNNDLVAMHTHAVSGSMTMPEGALHPIPLSRLRGRENRPEPVAVGTIIWLASELMFFAALFAAYFTIRNVTNSQAAAAGTEPLWTSQPALINMPFAILNTSVLVASSFTCQMGVFAAERGQVTRSGGLFNLRRWGLREWYTLTFLMGAFFIGGQAYEYAALFHEGLTISSNVYGSVFFLATGFHGLHVTGGLFAFLLLMGRTFLARTFTHEQAVSAVVVSYYWHFVDVVWIALFGVIYILQ
jgi:cytochrome c oxidase subunit III